MIVGQDTRTANDRLYGLIETKREIRKALPKMLAILLIGICFAGFISHTLIAHAQTVHHFIPIK